MDDIELHERLIMLDPGALSEWEAAHRPAVVGWLVRGGLAPSDAEEVWNDVFAATINAAPNLEPRGPSLRRYAFKVARNLRADRLAAAARMPTAHLEPDTDPAAPDPARLAVDARRIAALLDCLERCPERYRVVAELAEGGHDVDDLARILGVERECLPDPAPRPPLAAAVHRGGRSMTNREWLADQIREDALIEQAVDEPEAPWLDQVLSAALAESGLSDRSIALLIEAAADPGLTGGVHRTQVLVEMPPIALRRQSLGVSTADAAARLGVAQRTYENMEVATPFRWLNVDAGKAAAYLGFLGIGAAAFMRWLASLQPTGPQVAWGYRPGVTADRPVETGDADQEREHLVAWGRTLLAAEDAAPVTAGGRELLGHRWAETIAEDEGRRIAEAARERILSTPQLAEIGGISTVGLIALTTGDGTVYPAFQFDAAGVPIPIVVEINGLLGADDDPWGVTDWWLTSDPTIGASPADLAGGGEEAAALLRAAAATLLRPE